ncbi:hypothetical protein [Aureimonas leprariae]|uniref:DUF485 domain-containing protein n=1 Tax=Plantimonas leprariae TaxID=2615207 RepID=A0A7V7PSW2_9HYPH|nr:hypothetical protein [Aureimonas leprariae]KAB0682734.1 hypothetical protein F6X38_01225 [Aureimonas leprariae]
MAVTLGSETHALSLAARIDRMHRRDRLGALTFVAALWFVLLFVLVTIWPHITDGAIRAILAVCGAGLLILNTAAIFAMLRHYESDKEFIYGLDLTHLDEMRRRKRA